MTDNEINQAIAEECGWNRLAKWHWTRGDERRYTVPNYCHDLNAMHEVWSSKIRGNDTLEDLFTIWLGAICCGCEISESPNLSASDIAIVSNATARQRAKAFLLTLGKWRDE